MKTLNITTGELNTVIPETGRLIAQFDYHGTHIICTEVNWKTIKMYDMDGVLIKTVRIHSGIVNNISALPLTNSFISAGDDGGKLCTFTSPTHKEEEVTRVITWCSVLPNQEELVTLGDDGEVCVWDVRVG